MNRSRDANRRGHWETKWFGTQHYTSFFSSLPLTLGSTPWFRNLEEGYQGRQLVLDSVAWFFFPCTGVLLLPLLLTYSSSPKDTNSQGVAPRPLPECAHARVRVCARVHVCEDISLRSVVPTGADKMPNYTNTARANAKTRQKGLQSVTGNKWETETDIHSWNGGPVKLVLQSSVINC